MIRKVSLLTLTLTLLLSVFHLNSVFGTELEWRQFCTEGNPPPGAVGSTLVGLDDKLYSFAGGQECPSKIIQGNTTVCTPNIFFNHVYVCDLETNRWNLFETIGQKPENRSFHKCVMHRNSRTMYCYGGTRYQNFVGLSFDALGDFWKLNIQTKVWTQINNTAPGVRVDPGMTIDDDNDDIYLGFGVDKIPTSPNTQPEEVTRNDLWKYNVISRTWQLLSPNDPYHNVTSSVEPNVRYQCRMDFNKRHRKILVYGGDVLPDNRRTLCDLWGWDIIDQEWQLINNCSVPPLFTGASATFRDNYFLFTGEDRGGRFVACTDPENGKTNSPVNLQYFIDITKSGSSFAPIRGYPDIVDIMQSGYTTHRGKIYISLGLQFDCIKDSLQGGPGRRALQRYPTIVWGASLPDP